MEQPRVHEAGRAMILDILSATTVERCDDFQIRL